MTEEDLEEKMKEFEDKSFYQMLYKMFNQIEPRDSARLTKEEDMSLRGKVRDHLMLFVKAFMQVSPILTIAFLILALPDRIAENLTQIFAYLGIRVSFTGVQIGLLSIVATLTLVVAGYFLLIYGGSQRSQNLIMTSQNPNPRLDFHTYRIMMKWMKQHEEDIEEIKRILKEGKSDG